MVVLLGTRKSVATTIWRMGARTTGARTVEAGRVMGAVRDWLRGAHMGIEGSIRTVDTVGVGAAGGGVAVVAPAID
jgi:hypothetical protein